MNIKIITSLVKSPMPSEPDHYIRNAHQALIAGRIQPEYLTTAMRAGVRLISQLQKYGGVDNVDTRNIVTMLSMALKLPPNYKLMAVDASVKILERMEAGNKLPYEIQEDKTTRIKIRMFRRLADAYNTIAQEIDLKQAFLNICLLNQHRKDLVCFLDRLKAIDMEGMDYKGRIKALIKWVETEIKK